MLRSFARTFASSGISLLIPLFVQAQALPFSVGSATAAPGQTSAGYLEVAAGVDAATNIPVIVINGEKCGWDKSGHPGQPCLGLNEPAAFV